MNDLKSSILTDLEFIQALSSYDTMTRSAILLTLVTDLDAGDIYSLTWSYLKKITLPKRAIQVLSRLPRQLFGDLVFWSVDDGVISPLNIESNLATFLQDRTLSEYRRLYREMVFVSQSSKLFMREVSEQIFWRT